MYRLASDDDQPQVGLEQVVLGPAAVRGEDLQLRPEASARAARRGELVLGEQAGLDPLGQLDLLRGVEQRHLADLLEVVLDRVGGGAGLRNLGGRLVGVVPVRDEAAGPSGCRWPEAEGYRSRRSS